MIIIKVKKVNYNSNEARRFDRALTYAADEKKREK